MAAVASGLIIASGLLATRLSGGSRLDYAFTASQTRAFPYSYTAHDIALAMPIVLAAFAITMMHHAQDPKKCSFLVAMAVWESAADYG